MAWMRDVARAGTGSRSAKPPPARSHHRGARQVSASAGSHLRASARERESASPAVSCRCCCLDHKMASGVRARQQPPTVFPAPHALKAVGGAAWTDRQLSPGPLLARPARIDRHASVSLTYELGCVRPRAMGGRCTYHVLLVPRIRRVLYHRRPYVGAYAVRNGRTQFQVGLRTGSKRCRVPRRLNHETPRSRLRKMQSGRLSLWLPIRKTSARGTNTGTVEASALCWVP
ncbi:hypothetical protein BRADI_2g21051v3 [Brachypodium distachyon]|uniref:Uncharacterized protein n=1 Tax=Brachypodium distachyon TaxID=15368 RepID=A0A2K2D9Q5_BRADI|nr:hypothetical protein BRADI_2g21051v3 [Brachypodium distachyon]